MSFGRDLGALVLFGVSVYGLIALTCVGLGVPFCLASFVNFGLIFGEAFGLFRFLDLTLFTLKPGADFTFVGSVIVGAPRPGSRVPGLIIGKPSEF